MGSTGSPRPRILALILGVFAVEVLMVSGIHGDVAFAQAAPRIVLGELFTSDG